MKRTRIIASLLSICMLTSLFATSLVGVGFAASTGAAIVISNTYANTGMIVGEVDVKVYEIFSATINTSTTADESFDYTLTPEFADFFEEQIDGNTGNSFNYPDVADASAYPGGATNANYITDLELATEAAKEFIESYHAVLSADGTSSGKTTAGDPAAGTMQELVDLLRVYVLTNGISTVDINIAYSSGASTEKITITGANSDLSGYYLVLDSRDTLADNGTAAIAGMLCNVPSLEKLDSNSYGTLTANTSVTLKGSIPTITKQIWHDDEAKWDDVGDFETGETVSFLITASVPTNVTGYTDSTYTYVIEDTMSDGLTVVPNSVKIYTDASLSTLVGGTLHSEDSDGYYSATTGYYDDKGNRVFTYDFDMVSIASNFPDLDYFYITYDAVVDDSAAVASDGYETNTVALIYSTNPYDSTAVDSIEDTVYSFTFDLNVLKTSGDGVTPLKDATFELYHVNGISEGNDAIIYLESTGKAGEYYICSGKSSTTVTQIVTGDEGTFRIIGLDDQTTYKLVEADAPTGYNAADPLSFTITAGYTTTNGIPSATVSVSNSSVDVTNNSLATTIVNTSSALLPTTGGMGTTLFTAGGVALMLGAGVVLLIKRKKTH